MRGLRTLAMLTAAIGVPLFFVGSSWVAGRLESALRLEVEPSFTGGKLAAEFSDPLGDDGGPGGYEYPLGQNWKRGELDIVRYAVRRPVLRPLWGPSGAYWELEASFAKALPAGLVGGGAPRTSVFIVLRCGRLVVVPTLIHGPAWGLVGRSATDSWPTVSARLVAASLRHVGLRSESAFALASNAS